MPTLFNRKKIDNAIRNAAKRLMKEDNNQSMLVPATDKNGNVVMVTPITADHITQNPGLADKIKVANGGQTAQVSGQQTTTSTGTPTPVSGVAQPNPTYNNVAGQQPQQTGQESGNMTEDQFVPDMVDPTVKEGKNCKLVFSNNGPRPELARCACGNWKWEVPAYNNLTDKQRNAKIVEKFNMHKKTLKEHYNSNAYNTGNSNSFEDTNIGFEDLQEFASNPNNIYRNAAQRFLQELAWKKSAQSIVFLLKERGFLKGSDSQESIEDLHEVLTGKATKNISAIVKENKLAIITGFNLNDGDRKAYIVAEMWYTTDGHLRAINLKAFKDKGEKKEAYKDILKEGLSGISGSAGEKFDGELEKAIAKFGLENVLDGLSRYCSKQQDGNFDNNALLNIQSKLTVAKQLVKQSGVGKPTQVSPGNKESRGGAMEEDGFDNAGGSSSSSSSGGTFSYPSEEPSNGYTAPSPAIGSSPNPGQSYSSSSTPSASTPERSYDGGFTSSTPNIGANSSMPSVSSSPATANTSVTNNSLPINDSFNAMKKSIAKYIKEAKEHEIRFGTLDKDGKETNIKTMKQSNIAKCPQCIFAPEHYREDGSCRCNDKSHKEMKQWGYKWDAKKGTWNG